MAGLKCSAYHEGTQAGLSVCQQQPRLQQSELGSTRLSQTIPCVPPLALMTGTLTLTLLLTTGASTDVPLDNILKDPQHIATSA